MKILEIKKRKKYVIKYVEMTGNIAGDGVAGVSLLQCLG